MTGEPIRDLGYLAWENKYAWIEPMKGKQWQQLLRHEKTYWNALVHPHRVQAHARQFEHEFERDVVPRLDVGEIKVAGVIMITLHKGEQFEWRWIWSTKKRKSVFLDTDGTHVWFTESDPKDSYRYIMTCETMDGKVLWQKHDTSLEVCISNNLCYYIKLKYPFDTIGVACCDPYTGKHEDIIYRSTDPERFLTFVQGNDRVLFIQSGSWNESKTWRVDGKSLSRIHPETRFQFPIDKYNSLCVKEDGKTVYYGATITSWRLPPKEKYTIQWVDIKTGNILTIADGGQELWYCTPHSAPHSLFKIPAGEIAPLEWSTWIGEPEQTFLVRSPLEPPYLLRLIGNHLLPREPPLKHLPPLILPELTVTRHHTVSEDGTPVSYALVHSKHIKHPKKLLAYVYGAYGSQTVVMWPHMHWGPLFSRGWAVAYSYPRGAGDRDVKWMLNGQGIKHLKTIQDFEAVIRHAQHLLEVPPSRTVIYGRSAGGLMVGGTTARNPDGRLMGATFTEVPFVDALRSQTNPSIPLVSSGFSEYGNPLKSPVNFQKLLEYSPVNALHSDGAPGVFVLCRTGLKDLQVLPAEPLKWIQRLRGQAKPPAGKFLAYESDEAHVYSMSRYYKARAIDLAVLDLWADGDLKIPSASSRKNRSTEYKMAQQKKQQKQQQGGRRRRHTRRHRSRKGTRRHRRQ
jgi:hypothetical protein